MAKTNINFNNSTYQIDDSALSPATSALRNHLSTTMSGTGATINLNGASYNVDSAKLSAATNDFTSHLGTIAGNGATVMVNGVEYGIDSTKLQGAISSLETALGNLASGGSTPDVPTEERLVGDGAEYYTLAPTALSFRSTAPLNELQEVQINGVTVDPANYTLEEGSTIVTFPIDYLKTLDVGNYEVDVVSESKTVKGGFTVAAPELNEHSFYYNQPYSANLPMFGGDTAFFVRKDGTYDIITVGKNPDTGNYTMNGNDIVATHPMLGTITCTISSDGTEVFCNELQVAFKLSNGTAVAADEDYVYVYMEDLGGYAVKCIDKTKAEYGAIKTGINGIDTVLITNEAFKLNKNLVDAPTIPDSVTYIGEGAFQDCTSLACVTIPNGVTNIQSRAFYGCGALTSIVIPNSVIDINFSSFNYCRGLESIIVESGNAIYHSDGNCLIETATKKLHIGCKNSVIPTDGSVTSIGHSSFVGGGIEHITIPYGVTTIFANAFYDCLELTNITYTGTVQQWNAITKMDGWHTNIPATYVQCSDGQVAL